MTATGAGPSGGGLRLTGRGSSGWAQSVVVLLVVLAGVGMTWLKRLLSCACMGPERPPLPDRATLQKRSRSVHGGNPLRAQPSQNHMLLALSRYSAQLRKGDGMSREGSRHGATVFKDPSVRGNRLLTTSEPPPPPPLLLNDLTELQRCGRGRLGTALLGTWQRQQRTLVKVMAHAHDCAFMMEQVGEVWTRLDHPNIVACYGSDTFLAAALTTVPLVSELLPRPYDAEASLQTWFVLERCADGSVALLLSQRHQQREAARKAAAAVAAAAGGPSKGSAEALSATKQIARRLGRFSRGGSRRKALVSEQSGSEGGGSGAAESPRGDDRPSPTGGALALAATALAATAEGEEGEAAAAAAAAAVLPAALGVQPSSGSGGGAAGAGSGGGASGGGSGDEAADDTYPGLLPLADVLAFAHDVASGLAYLHSLDLCHGDLRAENVLVQTVVLPGSARAAGAAAAGALGFADGLEPSGAGGGRTRSVGGAAAAAAAGADERGNAMREMYDSNSANSNATDHSGTPPAGGGEGAVSRMGRHVSHSPPSLLGGAPAATSASQCAVPDSSTHGWSNSLRQSNGFMSGSNYTTTTANSTTMPGGAGLAGTSVRGGFGRSSIDGASGYSNALSNGSMVYGTNNSTTTPAAAAAAASGSGRATFGLNGGRSQLGAAAAAAAVAAGAPLPDGPAGLSPFTNAAGSVVLGTSATGGRGEGLQRIMSRPALTPQQSGPLGQGGTPFSRKQSGGLSGTIMQSGNDMSAVSKALSGLTAWPESPHENNRPLTGSEGTEGGGGGAGSGGPSSRAFGPGMPANRSFAADRSVSADRSGSGPMDRSGSMQADRPAGADRSLGAASNAGSFHAPPARRAMPMGGLSSALHAPEGQAQLQPKNPASPLPPAAAAAAQPPPRPPRPAAPPSQHYGSVGAAGTVSHLGPISTGRRAIGEGGDGDASATISPRGTGASAAAAAALEAAAAAALGSSAAPPDDACSPRSANPTPSTPPTPADRPNRPNRATSPAGGGSVPLALAPVHARRCSAPPVVSLPVVRRVAKLTDPWLSLAMLPPESTGGPWSLEASASVGVTTGADISHLPPELLLSGRLQPASDVYSLGVLLWRMLSPTGLAPYDKLQPAEVAYKVTACGMRPAFSPAVPEMLRRLVEDCWLSDPLARPSVGMILQRLVAMQAQARELQRQWRERNAIFGAVSTVPISAVAVLPLRGEQVEVAARWAEAAGIKLGRTSMSFGGGAGGSYRADQPPASFGRRSSAGLSTSGVVFPSALTSGSASAAHLYQQPPPYQRTSVQGAAFVDVGSSHARDASKRGSAYSGYSGYASSALYDGPPPLPPAVTSKPALEPF